MTAIVNLRKALASALLSGTICVCQTPATTPQKGSLTGTVVSLAGEPLKSANLHLQPVATPGKPGPLLAYATSSDAQGNFLFENIDPARYTLSVERNGYLRLNYSANSRSASSVLDLSSGQQITGIALKMSPQAVIAGRVTNQDGEPFPGVRVWISHWVYVGVQSGLSRWTASSPTRTAHSPPATSPPAAIT